MVSLEDLRGLYADVLDDFRAEGIAIVPWDELPYSVRDSVLALGWSPQGNAKASIAPHAMQVKILIARTLLGRFRAFANGDESAFKSHDLHNNWRVCILYDLDLKKDEDDSSATQRFTGLD